jgi:hypothetical protein
MRVGEAKLLFFYVGMGASIASSLVLMFTLLLSLWGKESLVYEANPVVAVAEIVLLAFAIGTCTVATEVYQKYSNPHKELSVDQKTDKTSM